MTHIDEAEVRRIARLAHLDLDDREVRTLRDQLGAVLSYVALLDDLPILPEPAETRAVPADPAPVAHPDEPAPCLPVEEALRNAPDAVAGWLRVPRTLAE
jgi:aspartyl-tRNA(Asn)/glutamyl-tRNA(Gln) amidotransferase subunit C